MWTFYRTDDMRRVRRFEDAAEAFRALVKKVALGGDLNAQTMLVGRGMPDAGLKGNLDYHSKMVEKTVAGALLYLFEYALYERRLASQKTKDSE